MPANLSTSAQWEDTLPTSSTATGVLADIRRMELLVSGVWTDVVFTGGNVVFRFDEDWISISNDAELDAASIALVDGYLTFY
jgi:hypothetical protein